VDPMRWNDLTYAADHALWRYRIGWFEEPVLPTISGGASWRAVETPIATGEQSAPLGFAISSSTGRGSSAGRAVGRVSEWMKVAALASATICPSPPYFTMSCPFDGLGPNALMADNFRWTWTSWFSTPWSGTLKPEKGYLPFLRAGWNGPGPEKLKRYRIDRIR